MSFKKAKEFAKSLQQTFTAVIPDGTGETYTAIFRLLSGEEAVWSLRIDPTLESETSFRIQQDLRSAISSIVKFVESEEILYPSDIVEVLFSPEELLDPAMLLNSNSNEATRIVYRGYWLQIKNCKTEEDYQNLPILIKEVMWELLYKGFRLTFDGEYLIMFVNLYNLAYRQVRPTVESEQLKRTLKLMLAKLEAREADSNVATQAD
jgi:hypothetical protein